MNMSDLLTGIDALLISNPLNIYYLTGFIGLAPDEREGYCLVTLDKLFLFINALYTEKAANLKKNSKELEVVAISRDHSLSQAIIDIASKHSLRKIGFEAENLTVAEHRTLAEKIYQESLRLPAGNKKFELVPTSGRVEEKRIYKTSIEIGYIKKAALITDNCFYFVQKKLVVGVTEIEIALEIEQFLKKNGASSAFSPIVAFGKNASQPHYESSPNCELRTRESVLLDFGAKVHGYCADMTRVVFIGQPDSNIEKAYNSLISAQEKALELLRRGERSGAKLDQAVQDELDEDGYPAYPHSLGHSLGLAIHELPRLSIKHDAILKPGIVFTVEPGIYVPGKFGLRIEDLLILTATGIEILSKSDKSLLVL